MSLSSPQEKNHKISWIWDVLLIIVMIAGVYFRFTGLLWGESQYLHPDERFLIWVGSDIEPVETITDYFNTQQSSLNPNNRGHGFYVYGTLPMFITRYAVEWVYGHSGFDEMTVVGRALSGTFDMLSVFMIYLIGKKLFDKRVGVIGAAFSALAVLQIQQSHFFTVDTFATFFVVLALYFAIRIATDKLEDPVSLPVLLQKETKEAKEGFFTILLRHREMLGMSALFGLAVGMAASSKINTVLIAVLLPLAYLIRWYRLPEFSKQKKMEYVVRDLVIAAMVAILAFRIFQPYAFAGPGFFNINLNPQWVSNMGEIQAQSSGDVDYPPALQWARRSITFSWQNLTQWGLGIPLGIVVWAGVIAMGWQLFKRDWKKYILLWGWTVAYFAWQSTASNSTMRYQLPIYPTLCLIGGWFVVYLYDQKLFHPKSKIPWRVIGISVGLIAVIATAAWAFAFTRIYVEPITRIEATHWIFENVPGPINLMLSDENGEHQQIISYPYDYQITEQSVFSANFTVDQDSILNEINFAKITELNPIVGSSESLKITLTNVNDPFVNLFVGTITSDFSNPTPQNNDLYKAQITPPLMLEKGTPYSLKIELVGQGAIVINGSAVVNESTWDDGLPLRMDGYDPYGGIYQRDLSFEMYWDDNADKLDRFESLLDKADYLFISSNRQWGTTTRVPERYPLATTYYRELLGCPADQDLLWCYRTAEPGDFAGNLGFDLVETFDSYPHIGNFEINDQFAEEAFTVYDHPKVLIFKKNANYDQEQVNRILEAVDLSKVIHLTPQQASSYPGDLMLPTDRLTEQQNGGTWSDLFDSSSVINQNPFIGLILWYVVITILGWLVYPFVRIVFKGLKDHGYPFSKLTAILLIAFFTWWAGSLGIPYSKTTISVVVTLLIVLNGVIAYLDRANLVAEFKERKNYFLAVEAIALVFFTLFLLVRLGNPDLWHPYKGGEKPMDFAYFNAVLKSTTFPPYDPWYAGGYINYYYYGFVIISVLVKWLGIVPSIAYNLILPSWFSFMALGAFSIGWNLFDGLRTNLVSFKITKSDLLEEGREDLEQVQKTEENSPAPFWNINAAGAGLIAAIFILILGNLGTLRMILEGIQKLVAPGGNIEHATIFNHLLWFVQGLGQYISGARLPFATGDWYWIPSRAFPLSPITEFPFFTFLYADPHAHLIALPITVLVLGWVLSILLGKWDWRKDTKLSPWLVFLISLGFGALVLGALRTTNTWDYPTYLLFAIIVIFYTAMRYANWPIKYLSNLSQSLQKAIIGGIAGLGLLVLSLEFYAPFSKWYGQGYTAVDLWKGEKTPLGSYFVHWGLFLFIIVSWLIWETIDWMDKTPLSSVNKLKPYKGLIYLLSAGLLMGLAVLLINQVSIAWFALPVAVWAGVLIFRKSQPDVKRFVLFAIVTALALTLFVEVVVLRGDIERMNTVFKFYLQAWTLFSLSAAAALVWLIDPIFSLWKSGWSKVWQIFLAFLVISCALYPIMGGMEKIKDRMATDAPHTLDGMTYMDYATYTDLDKEMDLSQDYRAIRWMQENVIGSPVIVEGNMVEYHWGSRFSIYTGLPSVVGWNWHQRQQRTVTPSTWVTDRIEEITQFYNSLDKEQVSAFLTKYQVRYIIVGQLEKGLYPGVGLVKFDLWNGELWDQVYHDGDTTIYQVRK